MSNLVLVARLLFCIISISFVNCAPYAKEVNPSVRVTPGTPSAKPQLIVKNTPFIIRGIAYSPVPIGEEVFTAPLGDYYTLDYAYIWQRDLPLIKAMGANALRVYYWDTAIDHTPFLDAVASAGLYIIPTFFIGDAFHYGHINTPQLQQQKITEFVKDVARYGDHPAILMWIYGNELNGFWNGLLDDFDVTHCNGTWWPGSATERDVFRGVPPCFYGERSPADPTCLQKNFCVYGALFDWINSAIIQAKVYTTRPMTTAFSDVDNILGADYLWRDNVWRTPKLDLVVNLGDRLKDMDLWALNVYVGLQLAKIKLIPFAQETNNQKLLIVAEFGIDAYNDQCGWSFNPICPNSVYGEFSSGILKGGALPGPNFVGCGDPALDCNLPGETAQNKWNYHLISAVEDHAFYSTAPDSVMAGAILLGWVDEYWKGMKVQAYCDFPCTSTTAEGMTACYQNPFYGTTSGGGKCGTHDPYTHITCGNQNIEFHDLCGYANGAFPDSYVNEQWFGITYPTQCTGLNLGKGNAGKHLDAITVRESYKALRDKWSGGGTIDSINSCDTTSQVYKCWFCTVHSSMEDLLVGKCAAACPITANTFGIGGSSGPSVNPISSSGPATGSRNDPPIDPESSTAISVYNYNLLNLFIILILYLSLIPNIM